jgi:hypothetical protein
VVASVLAAVGGEAAVGDGGGGETTSLLARGGGDRRIRWREPPETGCEGGGGGDHLEVEDEGRRSLQRYLTILSLKRRIRPLDGDGVALGRLGVLCLPLLCLAAAEVRPRYRKVKADTCSGVQVVCRCIQRGMACR